MERSREKALEGFCRSCGNSDHATEAHTQQAAQKEQQPKPKGSEKTLVGLALAASVPTDTNSLAFWAEVAAEISHEKYIDTLSHIARVIDAAEYLNKKDAPPKLKKEKVSAVISLRERRDVKQEAEDDAYAHVAETLARDAEKMKKAKELRALLEKHLQQEQQHRPRTVATEERFAPVPLREFTKQPKAGSQSTPQPLQKKAA